ncbi:MAG: alkaline phosphatase, partial [Acidimicrobiales bacterium]|nr:alkaline phosphatase [Acidimicrobiales bacterium]
GYCAQDRWIRTLFESGLYQHNPDGAFHPNAEGHLYAYATQIENQVAPALGIGGDPLPVKFDDAGPIGDALNSWVATLDRTGGLDALTNALPFGARAQVQTFMRDKFFGKFLPYVQNKIVEGNDSITHLSEKLDDLDGDGKPGTDAFGLANIDLDIAGDIQPKLPSKVYDITLTIKGSIAMDPDLALKAGDIGLTGQKADGKATFDQTVKIHLDFTKKVGDPGRVAILKDGFGGHVKVNLGADFGGTDGAANGPDKPALAFTTGGLGLKAVGPANVTMDLDYGVKDPNGDGVIDATEMKDPLEFLTAKCASGAVDVDLKASASLVGFTSKLGTIKMIDGNLCDGFAAPVVDLDDFGQFEGVTMVEFVNGLAQLSASLRSIQQRADVDVPFVKQGLADVISANDKLVKFFTDNRLTDPANPMANITFDPTKRPDLDTIDEILPKLATALGVPMDKLDPHVVDGRLLLDLSTLYAPGPKVGAGTLDFGDQLTRTGLAEVEGTAKATIDPSLAVNLGLGIDLRKGTAFGDRFFLQLDPTKPELTADAKVTAEAALHAKLSLLDVDLADDDATGPITLLDRKDATKPLLSVDLDGGADDRLTLSELNNPANITKTIKPTLNAKVPTFGLNATAKLGGTPFAAGKVTIGWADLTALTGANSLQLAVDGNFQNTLLPFAYDASNPRATVTQLLTATHAGVQHLRTLLETNPELLKALPLSGKRAEDIDPILGKIEDKLAQLIELDENLTLDQVEARVEKTIGDALGIANDKVGSIVTLGFTPQSGSTTNAALTATIDLGLCTTDRAALPGCAKTVAPLSVPLNFSLGNSEDSLAAVSSDGQVKVSFDARLRLGVGVELPQVAIGAAGQAPTVSGSVKPFVLDTSSFELGIGANVSGSFGAVLGPVQAQIGISSKPATASVAARYALKSSTANAASPKRIYAAGLTAWADSLAPKAGAIAVHDTTSTKSSCSPVADACATLPVTVNGAYLGDLGFRAPDLLTPSGWTFDTAQVVANLKTDSVQYALLVGGIRSFTERLEATLRNMPAGSTIPLLGSDPTAGANVLASFRTGVLDPMQDLTNQLTAANNASGVRTKVQDFLFDKIGPAGSVSLLRDGADAGTDVTKGDIEVVLKCKTGTTVADCTATDAATKIEDFQVRLPLGKSAGTTTKPLDSGFPGLRLTSDTGLSAAVGFQMDLAFGIDRTNGFYIPTDAFGTGPELKVEATASLPNKVDAQIAFIPASISDLTPGQPDVAAMVGVDLAGGGTDAKITLSQLGTVQINPSLSACANVRLGLATGGDKKFPSLKADLKMTGGIQCQPGGVTGAPGGGTNFDIAFDNVRVNAGSFISDFAAPVAKTIRKYTGPLESTIDGLRKPIPGIAEAARSAGKPAPTWIDLMNAVDSATGGHQMDTINKITYISDLTRSFGGSTGTLGDIPLGSFHVDTAKAADPASAGAPGDLVTSPTMAEGGTSVLSRLEAAGVNPDLSDKLQPNDRSLTFPAFEHPQQLFQLLLGKDVPLVRFEAGGSFLHVPIGPYAFPVGPATVYFGGGLDVAGHFAAGFDTYGIRQAYQKLTSDNPDDRKFGSVAAGLLGGFYLDDYNADGEDVPELDANAEVVVGAGVGVPGFGVFAEGGVHANAQIDLKTEDGKLRPQQIIKQLQVNPNPVCLFNASARIDAFVRVNLSTPIKDVHFPIADAVILNEPDLTDFCNTQQVDTNAPVTAKQYSDGTLEVFTSPESDRIFVNQMDAAGSVEVSSALGDETFTGITRVFVDGAAGDDTITITSAAPRPGAVSAYVCGGPGRDSISVDSGPATIYGDLGPALSVPDGSLTCTPGPAGADSLQGGPDTDLIRGGDGNDSIVGNGGADDLRGEGGDDTILPGAGDDAVDGGAGNDTVSYADRYDAGMTIDLRAGKTSGATGTTERDSFAGAETTVGGPGADVLWAATGGSTLDGGSGDDTLHGAGGTDLLIGGAGNDTVLGGAGSDFLIGADGNDRMVGNDGSDTFQGAAGTDTADYSTETGPVLVDINGQPDDGPLAADEKDNVAEAEIVIGTDADDDLRAGSLPAELHGGKGDDLLTGPGVLYGEAGKDDLRGSSGPDGLYGGDDADRMADGAGDDTVDGGAGDDLDVAGIGADAIKGGTGFDTLDYSARTNKVYVSLNGTAYNGEANGSAVGADCNASRCDAPQADIEKLIGGSGNDELFAFAGSQTLVGGRGNDTLSGGGGIDRFEGGDGNDQAYDQDHGTSTPDGPGNGDTYVMGDGNDVVPASGGDEVIDFGAGNDSGSTYDAGDVTVDFGSGETNTFSAPVGNHKVTGGDGDDTFNASAVKGDTPGTVSAVMGDGDDHLGLNGPMAGTSIDLGPGIDSFSGSNTDAMVDKVTGGPGVDAISTNMGDDVVTDTDGGNSIYAGDGNDTVTVGSGSDEVRGGPGDDVIEDSGNDGKARPGWPANQDLWGEAGNDTITMTGSTAPSTYDNVTGNDGNDTLIATDGTQAMFGGAGNDSLEGRGGNDRVFGDDGDDTVDGGAGDDWIGDSAGKNTLIGGANADRIEGGAGEDIVSYAGRTNPVTVTVGYRADDGNAVDQSDTVDGKRDDVNYQVDHVIGTNQDDAMSVVDVGNPQIAHLEGIGGRDALVNLSGDPARLEGGDGNDTLIGIGVIDTLEGGNGNDLLVGGAGNDALKGGAGNDRFDQGSTPDGGDAISGDADTDVVDYSARPAGLIAFTTDGVANDGAAGEADNIAVGTESIKAPGTAANTATVAATPAKATALTGETVNVTVKVTGSITGTAGIPTGSIELTENGQRVGSASLDAAGTAVIPDRFTSTGTRSLVAAYRGDDRYRSATSPAATVTVGKVQTTTTLTALNSPTKFGDLTKLRIKVSGASGQYRPSGSVAIIENGNALQAFSITDGTADVTLSTALPQGSHALTAKWASDAASEASTSPPATVLVTADGTAPAPTVAVAATPTTPSSDAAFSVKATIAPSAGDAVAAGNVIFTATGTNPVRAEVALGTVLVAVGAPSTPVSATLAVPGSLGGGTWTVKATVVPTGAAVAQATGKGTITVSRPATSTTLATNLNPAQTDDGITFTATVVRASGSGIPTGRVTFLDNGAELGSAPLGPDGKTTYTRALPLGTHQMTARYDGSDLLATSTSAGLSEVVKSPSGASGIATTTALSRSGNVVTATVTPASGSAPAGQVRFTLDGTSGAPVALAGGKATFTLPTLSVGTHKLVGSFLGSTTHAASASPELGITVAATPPSAPGTPVVSAVTKDAATITWTAPSAPGSSPVTSYVVTAKVDAAGTVAKTVNTGTATTTATVTGLTPGRLYRFTVAATSAAGTGPSSALSAHALPPFKTVAAFIDRQYRDFAGRAPSSTELASWGPKLTAGTAKPTDLMLAMSNSTSNSKLAYVVRTYFAFFQTVPSQAQLDAYAAKLRAGSTVSSIAQTWAASSSFKAKYGTLTNTDYVKRVHLNTLKRNPTSAELAAGLKYLGSGTTKRGAFMVTLSEGASFKARLKGLTELYSVIRPGLGRVPTSAERTQWEANLKSGAATRTQVLAWLLTTAAYDARV